MAFSERSFTVLSSALRAATSGGSLPCAAAGCCGGSLVSDEVVCDAIGDEGGGEAPSQHVNEMNRGER